MILNKKILLVVAQNGFQPDEYAKPRKILEQAGARVFVAGKKLGQAVSAISSKQVDIDVALPDVIASDYDGIFFIGGPGALTDLDNEESYKIIRQIEKEHKPFGAICISPRILAKAGVLEDKKVTGWDGDNELSKIFDKVRAHYVRKPVVVDDKLITAWGPDAANEFGSAILRVMTQ
ncbi:MAG: DJ-1/PfpI family protein [bacterium]